MFSCDSSFITWSVHIVTDFKMCSSLVRKFRELDVSLKLFLLISLFAWSSWIDINGVFVELPLLVSTSPQGWTLPAYLTVVIQLANIGPLIYLLMSRYLVWRGVKLVTEIPTILFIIITGAVASLSLAFTWNMTTIIGGKLYSTPLILLTFFLSIVDCMSSVTFLPFMAYFPQIYITAYYVGSGLSGFLPSTLALVQGVGKVSVICDTVLKRNVSKTLNGTSSNNTVIAMHNVTEVVPIYTYSAPRFSVQIFFFFITAMLLTSFLAFIYLVRIKRNIELSQSETADTKSELAATLELINRGNDDEADKGLEMASGSAICQTEGRRRLSFKSIFFLLTLNVIINGFCNGVIPTLLSYACLPYGFRIYHLTLVLSAAINPLTCFLYFFASIESVKTLLFGVVLYLSCCGYTVWIASTSPCPLMNDSNTGGIVVLLVSVLGVGLVSYIRTAISSRLQLEGHKALVWCGVSTQLGSFIGAITMFPLVSIFKVFQDSVPCKSCS